MHGESSSNECISWPPKQQRRSESGTKQDEFLLDCMIRKNIRVPEVIGTGVICYNWLRGVSRECSPCSTFTTFL